MNPRATAITLFERSFGSSPDLVVRSPGRVNLMGDHTDYNQGYALPMAIEPATWVAFAKRDGPVVEAVSATEEEPVRFELASDVAVGGWANYVQGTVHAMEGTRGLAMAIASDLPIGAGLSSSASLEMAVARIVAHLEDRPWEPLVAAKAGQRAENEWVGVATGLLDQISVTHAIEDHVLLVDFATLDVTPVRLPDGLAVMILDGGGRRSLTTSEYDDRRAACGQAAQRLGVASLRDLTVADLDGLELPEPELRRVRHVVSENQRVLDTVAAFAGGDLAMIGALMEESHRSLRDDYEVVGAAQEAVVMAAHGAPGLVGARMTGGGFAGTAVAIVEEDAADDFITTTVNEYRQASGETAIVYPTHAAAGVAIEQVTISRDAHIA